MPTGDLELANGVMRIVGGKLTKQYEEEALLHNRMHKGKGTKISDRGYEIPAHLEGNYNHTFVSDGGDLPAGGSNRIIRATVFFRNYVHAVRLTGAAMDAVSSMDVAYIKDWLQFNLDESYNAAHKMLNRYGWGTANGRLATISAGANSLTQTVNNDDANRYIESGMRVDIISTDGVTVRGTQVIDNAKASATTFTLLTTAINSTTGDFVVAAGGFNRAVAGMQLINDDTTNGPVTFQGISRNTYTSYRNALRIATGTGLDVVHMRRALGAGVHIKAGKLDRGALEIWSHPAQQSAYEAMGWSLKRYEGKSKSLDLGFTSREYEGIPWVIDVDCPKNQIHFLDWSTMMKFTAKELGFDDKSGSILRQVPSSTSGIAYTDQYEAYLTGRFNYGCARPNKNALIDTLSLPIGF